MAKTKKQSRPLYKKGLIEDTAGKLILFILIIVVVFIIYLMLSGQLSQVGTGMQWLT